MPDILFLVFPFSNFLEDVDWLDFVNPLCSSRRVNPLCSSRRVYVTCVAAIVCGRGEDSACVARSVFALHLVKNGMARSICVL